MPNGILHNRVSQKELKELLHHESEKRITISFYQYHPIENPQDFRNELYKALDPLKVFGRIYVASEGINAQISVPDSNFEALKAALYNYSFLDGIRLNIAVDDDGKSFWVLKIKVRNKIVADGIEDSTFSMQNKGKYLTAPQMNELLNDENTVVVDMRNHYEYEVGHFVKAIEVPSDTFREQLPMAVEMLKDKKTRPLLCIAPGAFVAKRQVLICCITASTMFFIWKEV